MWKLLRHLGLAIAGAALSHAAPAADPAPLWNWVDESSIPSTSFRSITPSRFLTVRLDETALTGLLAGAPLEFTAAARAAPPVITLPMPNGTFARFTFEESPVIEQGLADKYPQLKTYRAQGLDDPAATARFDWLPSGFHAMILAPSGTVLIDPYADGDRSHYITYRKHDATRTGEGFICHVDGDVAAPELAPDIAQRATVISGTALRTYRLALASTNEYAVAVGNNTIADTLAAEVLIMNRVNGVYERDVAIHMNIIANNDLITYAGDNLGCNGACTAKKDPYSNGNGSTMLNQNQSNIDNVIGSANYDIGHVFSTGGGGIAQLAVPCGNSKAKGVTGLSNPVGDPFAIDYVAHEMGHQWGANHTFNGTVSGCGGGNRSSTSAYEPGSAITIMGYAGICGNQDLAGHSIDTFHVKSLEAIVAYSQTGTGNNCAAATATGNTAPAVTGPGNFTIPKQTPFSLTAIAIDDSGATFTYDWEEYDLDAGNSGTTAVPNTDADGTARPIFRPYSPSLSGTRIFPSLPYILNNANVPPASTADGFLIGELLPAISRAMTFKVVARDNRANGGGINTATSTITINGASGPFVVTSPNTNVTVLALTPYTVTWNVAGTAGAPVSAASVRVLLSIDGGQTFPIVLAASTPNDGAQTVFFPNLATTTARVRVEAIGNIFFDISDANFEITVNNAVPTLDIDASGTSSPYDALTDGVLLVRYLFGVTGAPLTAGALGSTATRTDPADIKNYLDAIYPALDVDGNGSVDPATDGLLIIRYLFGLRGDVLIAGALGALPSRSMPMDIEHYIQSLMP